MLEIVTFTEILVAAGLLGLAVFVFVVLKRWSATAPSTLQPWRGSRWTQVDGLDIHYVVTGRGPYLVLLHGLGASVFCWRLLMPLLSKRFTVVAPDLPGFGRSSKNPDAGFTLDDHSRRLSIFLDQLKISQCRVVGSSMGGTLALWLALQQPERFLQVAVLAPATKSPLFFSGLKHWSKASSWLHHGVNRQLMEQILKRVVSDPKLITSDVVESYLAPYEQNPEALQAFFHSIETITDSRLPQAFKDVHVPVLVLWGQKDKMISKANLKSYMRLLKTATVAEHPEAGHHLQEDDPEWVAESLFRFFDSSTL